MEIHLPHRVASLKEFLRELVTITAGILIALSLEGLLEWRHHHEMVREARANIVSELRENQHELTNELQDLVKMRKQAVDLVNLVHQLEENRNLKINQVQLIWSFAELHSTSWDTAGKTNALAYMPYSEVKRYSAVYDLQHAFADLQQRSMAAGLEVQGLSTLLDRKTQSLTTAELADAERRIGLVIANVTAMQQIAQPLNQRYAEVLKSAESD